MTTGAKLGIVAVAVVATLFVWIAIDVRQDNDSTDATGAPAARRIDGSLATEDRDAAQDRGRPQGQVQRQVADAAGGGLTAEGRTNVQARSDAGVAQTGERDRRLPDAAAIRQEADGERVADAVVATGEPAPGTAAKAAGEGSAAAGNGKPTAGATNRGGEAGGAEAAKPAYVPAPGDLKPDANLAGADLSHAVLEGKDLQGADLSDSKLHRANLMDALLNEATLAGANLTHANMRRAELVDVDMSDAMLDQADLRGAKLEGSNLSGSSMFKTNVAGVSFYGADLADADFREAILFGVDLRSTNLENVNFLDADMRDANLTNADLTKAQNLSCAQLISARGWQTSFRGENLACGAPIPTLGE